MPLACGDPAFSTLAGPGETKASVFGRLTRDAYATKYAPGSHGIRKTQPSRMFVSRFGVPCWFAGEQRVYLGNRGSGSEGMPCLKTLVEYRIGVPLSKLMTQPLSSAQSAIFLTLLQS